MLCQLVPPLERQKGRKDCPHLAFFSLNASDFQDAERTSAPHSFLETVHTAGGRKAPDLPSTSAFGTTSTQLAQSEIQVTPYTPNFQGRPALPDLESLCIMEIFHSTDMLGPDKKVQVPSGPGCHQPLA
jgi:hypothetical protein